MSSTYRKLRPVLRLFVDCIVAGEKPTHAVRRLRPRLKRPDVLAAKWKTRPEVRAAIAERQEFATGLEERITRLEEQIANLSAAVQCHLESNKRKGLEGPLRQSAVSDGAAFIARRG